MPIRWRARRRSPEHGREVVSEREREGLARLTASGRRPIESSLEVTLHDYWHERVESHVDDVYAGVPIQKFPEDLRVYEHLLWAAAPNTVIETGVKFGGSALWFRDRLRTLADYGLIERPHVIAIDSEPELARTHLTDADPDWEATISVLELDVTDPQLGERVAERLGRDSRCMVVEDSAHTRETTTAALNGLARFVAPGGFFVVEDGCIDIDAMRPAWEGPRGVLPALGDWLASPLGGEFEQRRDLELYGVTCHPGGFLQRRG